MVKRTKRTKPTKTCPHCGLALSIGTRYHFSATEQAKCQRVETQRVANLPTMVKFNVTVIDAEEYAKAEADPDYAPKERVVQTLTGETEADVRREWHRLSLKGTWVMQDTDLVQIEG
jgi:hypothetical protein